jgi:hypothetical protein
MGGCGSEGALQLLGIGGWRSAVNRDDYDYEEGQGPEGAVASLMDGWMDGVSCTEAALCYMLYSIYDAFHAHEAKDNRRWRSAQ